MIRRRTRLVVAGLWLLSLTACLATAWLWRRSRQSPGPDWRASFRLSGNRYTLRTAPGGIVVFGPPPGIGPPEFRAALADQVSRIRNEQLRWGASRPPSIVGTPRGRRNSPAELVQSNGLFQLPPGAVRPLLTALEDPDRFVAAHVLLTTSAWWSWQP